MPIHRLNKGMRQKNVLRAWNNIAQRAGALLVLKKITNSCLKLWEAGDMDIPWHQATLLGISKCGCCLGSSSHMKNKLTFTGCSYVTCEPSLSDRKGQPSLCWLFEFVCPCHVCYLYMYACTRGFGFVSIWNSKEKTNNKRCLTRSASTQLPPPQVKLLPWWHQGVSQFHLMSRDGKQQTANATSVT